MGFFTVGNLITLLIVFIALFLFRQLDRNRRAQNNLRKFVENAKEDLAVYTQKQGEIVRDFSIQLSTERDVAGELMRQLQQLTREEMAEKAAIINQIEERISNYDKSLSELAKMTARVQENLARIREESAFVENTGKRIQEAKEKMRGIEQAQTEKLNALEKIQTEKITTLEKTQTEKIAALEKTEAEKIAALEQNLFAMGNRVEQENIRIMENMKEETIASVKDLVSGLESRAETIERVVEDHREAVEKIEAGRKASLNRDIETINKTLSTAVERAGQRADKM
jgi:DNA repair exonuclease SbcCD ATPase subunit